MKSRSRQENRSPTRSALALVAGTGLAFSLGTFGCASIKSMFAMDNANPSGAGTPIRNPFGELTAGQRQDSNQNIILRSKKGERSVEVELPKSDENMSNFTIPVSPAFREVNRTPASGAITYADEGSQGGNSPTEESPPDGTAQPRAPSLSDREITAGFPQGLPEDQVKRTEIENGLGLVQADDGVPESDSSYLAAISHVKQLYRLSRYEAALLEVDDLVRKYQTDPKLYEMRGTLLERLGKGELALKSWNQALRFNPNNEPLRKFIERKQSRRSVASP